MEQPMGLFSKFKRSREDELVDLDDRSPRLGVKYRDLLLMNEIAKRAADLSQPRHVIFYLYAPSDDIGRLIAAEARTHGFEAQVRQPLPEYPGSWTVACETHVVLTPQFVRESVDLFEALAERHHADYDGWEAAA
ncbi:ribonuclease E inhibitor RraB [Micromonospora terminaliae]|uniref:Ribonuclease E inhibitor RraB n=1 Tax=Micromonospora terminaliae TaxID=1914461 RepID=A0AAJ2ZA07_9ACTN|nr:ribonuclease E inhibitor RraB [Micromonospora terminaliae]NES25972.1 ribonuclease E inhibitor RraB [Micromonospora terminaliae]